MRYFFSNPQLSNSHIVTRYLIHIYIASSLLVVIPLGFLFKFYSGPGRWWFNDYGAGVLYEIFWILVVFFFSPTRKSANRVPIWVFTITSALEILQLYHLWPLEKVRSYFLGRALIGTTFTWWDFPHYAIGCMVGWLLIKRMSVSICKSGLS